jgi:hypothetical protein
VSWRNSKARTTEEENTSRPASRQSGQSRRSRSRTPSPTRSDSPPPEPKVVHIDPARLNRNKPKPSFVQRMFGRLGQDRQSSSRAEEGRATRRDSTSSESDLGDDGEEAYTTSNDRFRPAVPVINEPESILASSTPAETPELERSGTGNGLDLERTRTARSIRFTHDVSESSDLAPSISRSANGTGSGTGNLNYGSLAPGFQRTPGLGIFRTTSIQRDGEDGPSVSFSEPKPMR